jgi:hypothetical protein
VRHERIDGLWRPVFDDARIRHLPPATAVDVLASEFREFLGHVAGRSRPEADAIRCGIDIARLLEAIEHAATSGRATALS